MLRATNVRCSNGNDGRNLAGHAVRAPDAQEEPWYRCHRRAEPGAGDRRDDGDLQRRQCGVLRPLPFAEPDVSCKLPRRRWCGTISKRSACKVRRSSRFPNTRPVRMNLHGRSSVERVTSDRVRPRSVRRAGRPDAGRPHVSRRRSACRGAQRAAVAREVCAAIRMPSDSR